MYKPFLTRPLEAWYQLSEDEQQQLLTKVNAALEQVGGKRIVLCNSSWTSRQWYFWGVEQFPDIEVVQKHTELLNELNWYRYGEGMVVLRTEFPPTE